MNLSQVQIIRSLGDHLAMFEQEAGWGAPIGELRHLTGRIGELYAAMITRGQMAARTNQRGYDVVGGSPGNERISVKTVTSSNHVSFNPGTLDAVDRIIVLRLRIEDSEAEIEELWDSDINEARATLRPSSGKLIWPIPQGHKRKDVDLATLRITRVAEAGGYMIRQYENGTIRVTQGEQDVVVAKPVLRDLAKTHGVPLVNGAGNAKNTRQLGSELLSVLASE